jgi:predicted secreted protein
LKSSDVELLINEGGLIMPSGAISGMGVKFWRWDASLAWVAIAEISAIDGPSKTRETIEVTALDSIGGYREYIPSLREGGTISLTMNYTRATYDLMNDDFEDNNTQNYMISIPDEDNTMMEFEGLVTEIPFSASVGDKITANVTIKITGKVYLFSGASDIPNSDSSPAAIEEDVV